MRAWSVAALIALSACGYTVGARPPAGARRIHVAPIVEHGVEADAAGVVAVAVRRTIARGPSTTLVDPDLAAATLQVEIIDTSAPVAPGADPAARAAEYASRVRLSAALVHRDGRVLWRSSSAAGEALFVSVPGPMEALEGARRRALAEAARDAADALVTQMLYGNGRSAKLSD